MLTETSKFLQLADISFVGESTGFTVNQLGWSVFASAVTAELSWKSISKSS